MKSVAHLLILSFLFGLSSCSSTWSRLKASVYGNPNPLGEGEKSKDGDDKKKSMVAFDNRGETLLTYESEDLGANLAANEFSRMRDLSSDKASRGYRRPASPWDGVNADNEGSLWDENLQSNFLFARNVIHKVGDLLTVVVDSEINASLNEKIHGIIQKQWPERFAKKAARNALNDAKNLNDVAKSVEKTAKDEARSVADTALADEASPTPKYVAVNEMTVRITETLPRGGLKIAGSKRVQIKGAPYHLHISGVIQGEDIGSNQNVASNKVLESKLELTR